MTLLDSCEISTENHSFDASIREVVVNESSLLFNTDSHPHAPTDQRQIYIFLESEDVALQSNRVREIPISLLLPLHPNQYYQSPFKSEGTVPIEDGCAVCGTTEGDGKTIFALKNPDEHTEDDDDSIEITFTNTTLVEACEACLPDVKTAYDETLKSSPKVVSHTI